MIRYVVINIEDPDMGIEVFCNYNKDIQYWLRLSQAIPQRVKLFESKEEANKFIKANKFQSAIAVGVECNVSHAGISPTKPSIDHIGQASVGIILRIISKCKVDVDLKRLMISSEKELNEEEIRCMSYFAKYLQIISKELSYCVS